MKGIDWLVVIVLAIILIGWVSSFVDAITSRIKHGPVPKSDE
jgi:hypothetical protein